MLVIAGMPLLVEQRIFNCAVAFNSGKILGVVPKTVLPTYKEFYEDDGGRLRQRRKARPSSFLARKCLSAPTCSSD